MLVGRERRDVAERAVLERQDVALRAERVVGRADAATAGGCPVEGREIPDSSAGGQSPHTLKSARRSLNGETEKRISASRRASFSNLPRSAAV